MSNDRKQEVIGITSTHDGAPDRAGQPLADEMSATPEEIREAALLRDAIAGGTDDLAAQLRAAHSPTVTSGAALDALVDAALERASSEEEEAPSDDEIAQAEALRRALEKSDAARAGSVIVGPWAAKTSDDAASVADGLRSAWAPAEIRAERHEAILKKSLGSSRDQAREAAGGKSAERAEPAPLSLRKMRWGGRAWAGVGTAIAMAAGVLFLVTRMLGPQNAPNGGARSEGLTAQIPSRSTMDLFDPNEPFPSSGGESERVDRIADARAADLRANRFAAWGLGRHAPSGDAEPRRPSGGSR